MFVKYASQVHFTMVRRDYGLILGFILFTHITYYMSKHTIMCSQLINWMEGFT